MNWTLLVTRPARKALEKLPNKDQLRIEQALDELEKDPYSGDIKRLQPLEALIYYCPYDLDS